MSDVPPPPVPPAGPPAPPPSQLPEPYRAYAAYEARGAYGAHGPGAYFGGGEPPLDQPYYGAPLLAAVRRFWTKYATFSGRASRAEFWWWCLVALAVDGVLGGLRGVDGPVGMVLGTIEVIWTCSTIVPTLALLWRRLHDANHSGLWGLAPIIAAAVGGVLAVFGFMVVLGGGRAAGTALVVVALVLAAAGGVVILVLTLQRSRPEGTRFDRR